jgi:hypothetical protein
MCYDRLGEATRWADDEADKGNTALRDALPELSLRIHEGDIRCDCQECGSWDGLDRRCDCGNRRVYWEWSEFGWVATVY